MPRKERHIMIETEVLVEVKESFKKAKTSLQEFNYYGLKKTIDTYYYDPLRSDLKPYSNGKLYSSFRVRQKGDDIFVTYKNDHYIEDIWQYSDEYEIKVDDLTSIKLILDNLGFKKLLVIDSEKHFYQFNEYEIVLENVKDLGVFLEVELKKEISSEQVHVYKEKILHFIKNLDICTSNELNSGKPELYLQKNNITID